MGCDGLSNLNLVEMLFLLFAWIPKGVIVVLRPPSRPGPAVSVPCSVCKCCFTDLGPPNLTALLLLPFRANPICYNTLSLNCYPPQCRHPPRPPLTLPQLLSTSVLTPTPWAVTHPSVDQYSLNSYPPQYFPHYLIYYQIPTPVLLHPPSHFLNCYPPLCRPTFYSQNWYPPQDWSTFPELLPTPVQTPLSFPEWLPTPVLIHTPWTVTHLYVDPPPNTPWHFTHLFVDPSPHTPWIVTHICVYPLPPTHSLNCYPPYTELPSRSRRQVDWIEQIARTV